MPCRLLKQEYAPEVNIDCFNDKPLNYIYFMAIFKEMFKSKIGGLHGQLTRLMKYTRGKKRGKTCGEFYPSTT